MTRHLTDRAADFPNRLFRLAPVEQNPAVPPVQIGCAERECFFTRLRPRPAVPIHLFKRGLQGLVALAIVFGEPGQRPVAQIGRAVDVPVGIDCLEMAQRHGSALERRDGAEYVVDPPLDFATGALWRDGPF